MRGLHGFIIKNKYPWKLVNGIILLYEKYWLYVAQIIQELHIRIKWKVLSIYLKVVFGSLYTSSKDGGSIWTFQNNLLLKGMVSQTSTRLLLARIYRLVQQRLNLNWLSVKKKPPLIKCCQDSWNHSIKLMGRNLTFIWTISIKCGRPSYIFLPSFSSKFDFHCWRKPLQRWNHVNDFIFSGTRIWSSPVTYLKIKRLDVSHIFRLSLTFSNL